MTRIQHIDTIQIDAILICCGLGGMMVNTIPKITQELRKSFIEPIFAIATLPTRSEGRKRSAKASMDIEFLQTILDALILFDNELMYQKIIAQTSTRIIAERHGGSVVQLVTTLLKPPENPRDINFYLNERIARYIGLLLRAGEFNERGVEVGEVVLDAGEVLKTLTHMGIVAVGYAIDELIPAGIPSIFTRFRLKKTHIETDHERAARIVTLAKRAVYDEASIACDLTSAEKALILIAGPSHELSMRGFQAVQKWIDRSISGLEMRSGDYPVKNTRFIGIIIVLAGLHNVPRIEELKKIQDEVRRDQPFQLPTFIQGVKLGDTQIDVPLSTPLENASTRFKPSIPDSLIESFRPLFDRLAKATERTSAPDTSPISPPSDHSVPIISSVKKVVKKRVSRKKKSDKSANRLLEKIEKIVDFSQDSEKNSKKKGRRKPPSQTNEVATSGNESQKKDEIKNDFGIIWLE